MDMHNEIELLQSVKDGKEFAFGIIYETYSPSLISYVASRVASLEESRDIIQNLFVDLWENRARINVTVSLKSFLFAAVRYRIIDHIRKNITRKEYAEMVKRLSAEYAAGVEDELAAKDIGQKLEVAVNDLPTRTKEIYKLSRHQQLAIKEIAARLHLSEQTVKNQLSTALSHLRMSLERLMILWVWLFFS